MLEEGLGLVKVELVGKVELVVEEEELRLLEEPDPVEELELDEVQLELVLGRVVKEPVVGLGRLVEARVAALERLVAELDEEEELELDVEERDLVVELELVVEVLVDGVELGLVNKLNNEKDPELVVEAVVVVRECVVEELDNVNPLKLVVGVLCTVEELKLVVKVLDSVEALELDPVEKLDLVVKELDRVNTTELVVKVLGIVEVLQVVDLDEAPVVKDEELGLVVEEVDPVDGLELDEVNDRGERVDDRGERVDD